MKISHAPAYQMTPRQRLDWRIAQFEAEIYRNGFERADNVTSQIIMIAEGSGVGPAILKKMRDFAEKARDDFNKNCLEPEDVRDPDFVLVHGYRRKTPPAKRKRS